MLKNLLKTALRNILRQKGFSFINVVGLALGMAFAIVVMLWVGFEWSYDRFHENVDRLHLVAFTNEAGDFHGDVMVGALAEHLESQYPEIERATRVSNPLWWKLNNDGHDHICQGRHVDPSFLHMFTLPVEYGSIENAFEDPYSLIISKSMADKIFGDRNPVGATLDAYGTPLTVTAVVEDLPANSHFQFEFLASCRIGPQSYQQWDIKCIATYVLLDEHAEVASTNERIRDIFNDHVQQNTKNNLYLFPLTKMHLYALDGGGLIVYVLAFSAAALAVLLIACINFMNLSTARSERRSREIGIKKVVGAGRMQLVAQFLGESVILSLLALLLAMIIVELVLPVVNSQASLQLDLEYTLTSLTLLFGVAVLTGLFSGLYPALFLSSLQPISILHGHSLWAGFLNRKAKGVSIGRRRGTIARRVLVVGQFAVSITFILCVFVALGQIRHVTEMDLGFDADQIVTFRMPSELIGKTEILKNELPGHPGIEEVTVSMNDLIGWGTSFGISWEGQTTVKAFDMGFNAVDYDFAETFGIEMVEGRFFSRDFASDPDEAYVVNEAAVKAMEITDPVGKRITLAPGASWEAEGRIIGVVKDFNTELAYKSIRPFMMGLTGQGRVMSVRLGTEDIPGALGFIDETISGVVPDSRVSYQFFRDALGGEYHSERQASQLLVFIMVLSISIACLGLLGLASYSAQQRTKEIGIRKVLGASVGGIVRLLSKEFVLLVVIANAVAWPVAFYIMNRWLENFAYRVEIGWVTFALAGALALLIALGTVCFQAAKAAVANPVKALKYE